ncbi:MAG TPA: crotonase/enoyl-CoA hydratase family protein [Blastococcus sp.]
MTTATAVGSSEQGAEPAPDVLVERRGHVLLVTINRPAARNAVNEAVCIAVGDALEEAESDPDVRVVVLTGAGDRAFCAGADLKAITRGERIIPVGREHWGLAGWVSHPISKPTIAAVNGAAVGGGTEIVLASDLVVASETATFGLPEVQRGLVAGAGGAFRIVEQLPLRVGMEILLTGDPIDARRALELNLVNRVVSAEQLLDAALALAEKIASNAPLSVQASKKIALGLVDGDRPAERTGWENTREASRMTAGSQDAIEGPRAFAEKRAPVWTGR